MENRHLLKVWLVKNKISQKDAAEKISMHKTRFNSYINGHLNLPKEEVERICKALKIDYKSYTNNKIKEV